jgi:hypothetical protein
MSDFNKCLQGAVDLSNQAAYRALEAKFAQTKAVHGILPDFTATVRNRFVFVKGMACLDGTPYARRRNEMQPGRCNQA